MVDNESRHKTHLALAEAVREDIDMTNKPFLIVRADVEPKKDFVSKGKLYVVYGVKSYIGYDDVQRVSGYITTDTGNELFILISGYDAPCVVLGADWTIVED